MPVFPTLGTQNKRGSRGPGAMGAGGLRAAHPRLGWSAGARGPTLGLSTQAARRGWKPWPTSSPHTSQEWGSSLSWGGSLLSHLEAHAHWPAPHRKAIQPVGAHVAERKVKSRVETDVSDYSYPSSTPLPPQPSVSVEPAWAQHRRGPEPLNHPPPIPPQERSTSRWGPGL